MDKLTERKLPAKASEKSPRQGVAAIFLQSTIFSLALSLVFLLALPIAVISNEDPDLLITPLALIALYVSALAGGIFSGIRCGDSLFAGAISGGIFAVLVFLTSLLRVTESSSSPLIRLILYLLIVVSGSIGGIIGVKIRGTRSGRIRNRRKKMHRRR